MMFIDLEKAYVKVQREVLRRCLGVRGILVAYTVVIKDMYDGANIGVRIVGEDSNNFPFVMGLHQELALSPFLYTLAMNALTRHIQEEMTWMSTIENEPFKVVEKIPIGLHMWWNDLREVSRGAAIKALGGLTGYAGLNENLRSQYLVAPRAITPHKFLDLLSISQDVKDGNLAEGFCIFYFLYRAMGTPMVLRLRIPV
uniref:Uncharacterized protein LOC104217520 n=1 Tax=Nicotiana sylvestris TaxID=4096 RepID=A0A1U7VVY0_NICSY|nr:PREDICTED: uncharacterized protein LOC104217520 [Nicotiana sylvestris]